MMYVCGDTTGSYLVDVVATVETEVGLAAAAVSLSFLPLLFAKAFIYRAASRSPCCSACIHDDYQRT